MATITSESRYWPSYRVALAALVVGAWVTLIAWAASPYGGYLDHATLGEEHHLPLTSLLPVFVLGWSIMTLAMMLPTIVHPLRSFLAFVPGGGNRSARLALYVGGYTAVWAAFGIAAYLGDGFLHEAAEAGGVPEIFAHALLGITMLMAGLYQLTPAKRFFLAACSPAVRHQPTGGAQDRRNPVWLGAKQGLVCLGSCWALMLFMFALGGVQLGWMLALTALMTIESAMSWGGLLRAPIGLALMAAAVLLLGA
jgi:predicted metal-binding membrane protein